MAKKKPTHKSLRQGQTVYYVSSWMYSNGNDCEMKLVPVMIRIFISSHNYFPSGVGILKLPVNFLKDALKSDNKKYFYSKSKAVKRFNLISERLFKNET